MRLEGRPALFHSDASLTTRITPFGAVPPDFQGQKAWMPASHEVKLPISVRSRRLRLADYLFTDFELVI